MSINQLTRHIPIWARIAAIVGLVLLLIVVSTTLLSASGLGGHGPDPSHTAQMTDHASMASDHRGDTGHGSADMTTRTDHGSGHGSAVATPGPK